MGKYLKEIQEEDIIKFLTADTRANFMLSMYTIPQFKKIETNKGLLYLWRDKNGTKNIYNKPKRVENLY